MSADSMVATAMSTVPKAVAAGIVDMNTGMLLAVKTTDSHPQAVLDLVAAATKDLFEGETVMSIERHFKNDRGDTTPEHYFREILVTSKNLLHMFIRAEQSGIVLVVVTRIDANMGMVMMKTREVLQTDGL